MKTPLYFGIDGGGTHSRLAIVDSELHVMVKVVAGSTNIYSVSQETACRNLEELFGRACKEISIERSDLVRGCIGSAGLARPHEMALFRGFFNKILGPDVPVKLCTDGEILLCGGLNSLEGYCLVAGTGSVALGRSNNGTLVRAGGLGYMLGDEGSAWWIGHEAIVRTLRGNEKRDLESSLLPEILKRCKLSEPQDLVAYVHHQASKADIGSLAPLVTEAARNGDALALDILHKGAQELALLVQSVVKRSPFINHKELVLAGGVMEHDEIVRDRLISILGIDLPDLKIGFPTGSALEGACILALNEGSS